MRVIDQATLSSTEGVKVQQTISVLVVGSNRGMTDTAKIDQFQKACEELGAKLAERFTIIAASADPDTADYHVVRGTQASDGQPVRLISPRKADLSGLADMIKQGQVHAEKGSTGWPDLRRQLVQEADIAVLIGGGKGTLQTYEFATAANLPVVLVAAFDGTAAELFPSQTDDYLSAGLSEEVLANLSDWNSASADSVVQAIELLLEPGDEQPTLKQVLDSAPLGSDDRNAILNAVALASSAEIDARRLPLLIFAMLLRSADMSDPRDSSAMVVRWLTGDEPDSPAAIDAAIIERLKLQSVLGVNTLDVRPPSGEEPTGDVDLIDQLVRTAETFRAQTRPEGKMRTRHLLHAALVTGDSMSPATYLVEQRFWLSDFASEFLGFIHDQHPQDDGNAWEAILAQLRTFEPPRPEPKPGEPQDSVVDDDLPIVYLSYNYQDTQWKDQILEHLASYERELGFRVWHDQLIEVGERWEESITEARERAIAAIMVVSERAFASKSLQETEWPRLFERAKDDLWLLPIVIEPCDWKASPIAEFSLFPRFGNAVSEGDVDRLLADFAIQVADIVAKLKAAFAKRGRLVDTEDLSLPSDDFVYELDAPAAGPWREQIVGYTSDGPSSIDHLGIASEVSRLAAIIMAKDWIPPLAIGLFGDWGTGKSSFMLMMEQEIDRISYYSQRAEADDSVFVADVAQIPFNAWQPVGESCDSDIRTTVASDL